MTREEKVFTIAAGVAQAVIADMAKKGNLSEAIREQSYEVQNIVSRTRILTLAIVNDLEGNIHVWP